jgi:hypothetical protein
MGFDISGLGSYVQNKSKEYAMKAIAGAATAKLLIDSRNVQFGVKGTAAILKLNSDVTLVDSSNCGRTGGSNIALSNKNLVVKPIADEANLCPATLWNTFYAESVAIGQAPQEELLPAFADAIMTDRAMKIAAVNEQLIWRGDVSLIGVTNLKRIDGIVKQVTGTTVATGATTLAKLQTMFKNTDIDVRSQEDFHIFIGQDIYAEYLLDLAALNIYKPTEDFVLFGTVGKLFVAPGLNGSRVAVTSRLSNFQLGLDGEGDADRAEMRYSIETKQYYQDFNYALGVAVIWSEEAKKATL